MKILDSVDQTFFANLPIVGILYKFYVQTHFRQLSFTYPMNQEVRHIPEAYLKPCQACKIFCENI